MRKELSVLVLLVGLISTIGLSSAYLGGNVDLEDSNINFSGEIKDKYMSGTVSEDITGSVTVGNISIDGEVSQSGEVTSNKSLTINGEVRGKVNARERVRFPAKLNKEMSLQRVQLMLNKE